MSDAARTIDPAALAAALAGGEAPIVIDVLPGDVWEAHRIAGALNACVYEMAFAKHISSHAPDTAAAIVIYGAGGTSRDVEAAAAKLANLGYTNVAIVDGGLTAWHTAGHPTEGKADAPLADSRPPALDAGSWRLDIDKSWVRWVGRNPNGFHDGAVDITAGEVSIGKGGARGRFTVDPSTIRNFDLDGEASQPMLIAHLLSEDFLLADRFPDVAFELASVTPLPDAVLSTPTHHVAGHLEIRGVRAELAFDATVTDIGGGGLAVAAHFDIDRTRWGMIYGSARFFAHLGMHVVFDPIAISLRLVLDPV